MQIGDINSVKETACGFRTKLFFFLDSIERLRRSLGKEKAEMHIADIGCGNGLQMTFPLAGQGYSMTGVDMHKPSINFAVEKNVFKNARFLLQEGEDFKNVFHDGKFDVVILSDILEHVKNPLGMLMAARSILQPHGVILISIPNGYGPFEIENFILRKTGVLKLGRSFRRIFSRRSGCAEGTQTLNVENGHIQFFTRKRFSGLLKTAGLEVSGFRKGSFLAGSFSNALISRVPFLTRANIAAGKRLPATMCSVWYFECRIKGA